MSTQNDQSATVLTDNGSRFFGELDEVMVFSIGLDAAQAQRTALGVFNTCMVFSYKIIIQLLQDGLGN